MVGADGKPIKSDAEHGREYGPRMPTVLAEGVSVEFFVLPEVFRTEVCQGFDHRAMSRALLEHGALVPDKGRPFDCRVRLPGMGLANCYRIPPTLFALDL